MKMVSAMRRIRIVGDSDEIRSLLGQRNAQLLLDLADHGGAGAFHEFDPAARQSPGAVTEDIFAMAEKKFATADDVGLYANLNRRINAHPLPALFGALAFVPGFGTARSFTLS